MRPPSPGSMLMAHPGNFHPFALSLAHPPYFLHDGCTTLPTHYLHTHSLSHTHTLSLALSLTHTHSLTHSLTRIHARSRSLSLTRSLRWLRAAPLTRKHAGCAPRYHPVYTLHAHTHTRTHTRSLALSLTLSLSQVASWLRNPGLLRMHPRAPSSPRAQMVII